MIDKIRVLLFASVALSAAPATAQLTAPVKNGDTTIVVTGTKTGKGNKVEMSDWRMAETPHVVVFSRGDQKELVDTAHNLEKLHFLLSMLLNRVDRPDDTIKIAVTMIGDAADFEQLRLGSLRWQHGPFPDAFPSTLYYDPREEGPVLATTATGVKLILEPSRTQPTQRNCEGDAPTAISNTSVTQISAPVDPTGDPVAAGQIDLGQFNVGELSFCQPAQARLYAAFAQNFLLTYFPAAYPRWYLQGFGELFSTMTSGEGVIEYGRRPVGFREVMERYGSYPVEDVLTGRYLTDRRWKPDWTPYHAWRLVHLLFFSEEWRQPLNNYLKTIATGTDPKTAMSALGDARALQKAVAVYQGRKVPFERMSFPAGRAPAPVVRQLTRAEAGLVRGRLELGARIEVPAGPSGARSTAIARREAWLNRLRDNARRFPALVENQLLLAEAECRSGNADQCLQAADRSLAIAPGDTSALVWKGTALAQLAARASGAERAERLKEARSVIAKANRADPDSILPLIAYFNSFALAGEPAPDAAVDGLFKTVESSPAAPKPRLQLGRELAKRNLDMEAQRVLLPVARGAFEAPEQPEAERLVQATRSTARR
jgi:hypothetical protein